VDAIKCLKERRSVRSYTGKKISKEILEEIIDCSRLAPSARNLQPCEFVVVTDKETLKKIGKVCIYGPFIKDAAACVIVCGDAGNKHLIEDGCAAAENVLLAAKGFGIGSCWVAGWKRTYDIDMKEILNIPSGIDIVAILPLGYPVADAEAKNKRELNEVLHWEGF